MRLSAKISIQLIVVAMLGVSAELFAESSGSHAAPSHQDSHHKADTETDACYAQIKRHPYKALLCFEAIDPTLKILLKKDHDGNAVYENLIKACGHEYVGGVVNAKELGQCRKKLTPLDKYPRLP